MNRIYKTLSEMGFSSLYTENSEKLCDGIGFVKYIKTHPTTEDITFTVKKCEHSIIVTDNGSTLRNLDRIFELSEPDVVSNIKKILAYYGVRKHGYELILDLRPFGTWLPQLFHFLNCIRFLYLMIIFYMEG